jgi:hypothetical protein
MFLTIQRLACLKQSQNQRNTGAEGVIGKLGLGGRVTMQENPGEAER